MYVFGQDKGSSPRQCTKFAHCLCALAFKYFTSTLGEKSVVMANNAQKFLAGFIIGAAFSLVGLVTRFQFSSPLVASLWYNSRASQCHELQPAAQKAAPVSWNTLGREAKSPSVSKHSPVHAYGRTNRVEENVPFLSDSTSWSLKNGADGGEDGSSGKFLIYKCGRSNSLCGGWADRQKGMVSAFLLALVTNRRFGITMTTPCDVRKFYLPSEYNWIIQDKDIEGKTRRTVRSIDSASPFRKDLFSMDFNARYPEDVIFLTTNNEHSKAITANPLYQKSLPVWARQPLSEFFRDAWHILMKPSPLLQHRLDSFLHSLHFVTRTRPLVGLHVRVGKSASLKDFTVRIANLSALGPLWEFVEGYIQNGSQLFLATDNADVRQTSRAKFGPAHHDTEGSILHIDLQRTAPDVCQGFEDAVLDQLVLSRCDVIILPGSGFSRRAAMIGGAGKDVFQFSKGVFTPIDLLSMTW